MLNVSGAPCLCDIPTRWLKTSVRLVQASWCFRLDTGIICMVETSAQLYQATQCLVTHAPTTCAPCIPTTSQGDTTHHPAQAKQGNVFGWMLGDVCGRNIGNGCTSRPDVCWHMHWWQIRSRDMQIHRHDLVSSCRCFGTCDQDHMTSEKHWYTWANASQWLYVSKFFCCKLQLHSF